MTIYRALAPLRVSFAGGGTDIPPYCIEHGGQVISTTINKYVHITMELKRKKSIRIHAYDLGTTYEIPLNEKNETPVSNRNETPLFPYDGNFDIIKAVLNRFKVACGMDLHIYSDLPAASGMGTSSSLTVALIKLFSMFSNRPLGKYEIAEMAIDIERNELEQKGGFQDQYAAAFGGLNFITFGKKNKVFPLDLDPLFLRELNEWLVLVYTGKTHISSEIQKTVLKRYETIEFQKGMELLKKRAEEIRDLLLEQKISLQQMREFGGLLHQAWIAKKMLSSKISNEDIERLYEHSRKWGVLGGKLLGAGGGGFLLLVINPSKRNQLIENMKKIGGEPVEFEFSPNGAIAWEVAE